MKKDHLNEKLEKFIVNKKLIFTKDSKDSFDVIDKYIESIKDSNKMKLEGNDYEDFCLTIDKWSEEYILRKIEGSSTIIDPPSE